MAFQCLPQFYRQSAKDVVLTGVCEWVVVGAWEELGSLGRRV